MIRLSRCSADMTYIWLVCREQDLQRQLALTKNQLRDLRMSHETNQAKLLDHTQRQGKSTANG